MNHYLLILLVTSIALCIYSGYVTSVAKSKNDQDRNNLFIISIVLCIVTGLITLGVFGSLIVEFEF